MSAVAVDQRRTFFQTLWYWLLRALGWDGVYHKPDAEKFIIIVAPHTSNFDFFIGFIYSRAFGMPSPNFLAKDTAFRGVMGPIVRWLGGIPVNRRERTNFVDQVVNAFNTRKRMILAITPEGTRSKVEYWKSGFYHIALRANVPIVMATIDYARKFITCGDMVMATGDMEGDIARIRAFFAGSTGRYPERQGEIRFRPADAAAIQAETDDAGTAAAPSSPSDSAASRAADGHPPA